MKIKKLTAKQERFVQEYLICLNATQAAKKAGYSEGTAYSQGQRLLKNVEVAKILKDARDIRSEKVGRKAEDVIADIWEVTKRCMQIRPVLDKKGNQVYVETPNGKKAAAYVFNAKESLRGLELEGRQYGMFVDKLKVGGEIMFQKKERPDYSKLTVKELEQLEELAAKVQVNENGQ